MNDLDIVLGYLCTKFVGTINNNVQKKFMKLWCKKKKITLHDISLTKQEGSKMAQEVVVTKKLIIVPLDTLDEEFEVG